MGIQRRGDDNYYEDVVSRLRGLADRQDAVMDFMTGGNVRLPEFCCELTDRTDFVLPQFSLPDNEIARLAELPSFDASVLADWRKADLPVMLASGVAGALTSYYLREFFASLHDEWNAADTLSGGHGGETADWVPGSSQPGGWGHRWKYGHDMLNPFEIDWQSYIELAKQSGSSLPLWMQGGFYWLRHLLQDCFSKEGLPLPGHSLLRWLIDSSKPANREMIQFLLTIKMRDVVGAGLSNAIMGAYLWGTEGSISRVVKTANYRAFSLMAGANLTAILTGLLMPPPATSLNWGALPILGYYVVRLILMERKLHKELSARDGVIAQNEATLLGNLAVIAGNNKALESMLDELDAIDRRVQSYYNEVNNRQDSLAEIILGGSK